VAASGIDQIDQRVQQDTKDFAMTNKSVPVSVNARTRPLVDALVAEAPSLRIAVERLANGTQVIDAGIKVPGGLEAGRRIAEICLGGLGRVRIRAGSAFANWMLHVDVFTSEPVRRLEPGARPGQGRVPGVGVGAGARVG
jgi:methenyltetrahydromethanopterin cyclohydrolase